MGVGFSYSDTPSVDYHMDDNSTALDNYHFLVKWFQSYPEYSNNDFYITYVYICILGVYGYPKIMQVDVFLTR